MKCIYESIRKKCKNKNSQINKQKTMANNKCTYFENGIPALHAVISFSWFNCVSQAKRSNPGSWNRIFFPASLHQQLSAFTSIARYVINSFQIDWGMCRAYNGRTARTLLCFYPFFSLIWCIHRKFIYWGFFLPRPMPVIILITHLIASISVTDPIHSISRCEKSVSHRK